MNTPATSSTKRPYIGRFAPSPTGPLHFGSLLTAVASYCDAKHHEGQWLVRIEDTDLQRNQPQAIEHIYRTLEVFSLIPDQPIRLQSEHLSLYESILRDLQNKQMVYACQCSRKQLMGQQIYPETCKNLDLNFDGQAIRLHVPQPTFINFHDLRLGYFSEQLNQTTGDFVLKRRDGILSYQLCVVVDDALQQVTHIVRGEDLLDNTARQIFLQQCLSYPLPQYLHLPLAKNQLGQKLSKQNLATPLNLHQPVPLLKSALLALGQPLSSASSPKLILAEASERWQRSKLPQEINQIFS